jgi:hypothetical protein
VALSALHAAAHAQSAAAVPQGDSQALPPVTVQAPAVTAKQRPPAKRQARRRPPPNARPAANILTQTATASGSGAPNIGSGPSSAPTMASQTSVTGEELNARPATRPGELLEATPGLIVTQHSGEGKANQYFLRGYNLDHGTDLAISVDDVPVNMRTHAHGQGYADLNWLMPETVPISPTRAISHPPAICISD